MDGEFRVRDGVLTGYYFVYVTANWLFLAALGEEGAVAIGVTVGILSAVIVALRQTDRTSEAKFHPVCFAAFLFLTSAVVAVDLLIATW